MFLKSLKLALITVALVVSFSASAGELVDIQCDLYWNYPVSVKAAQDSKSIQPNNGWYNAGWHGASMDEANDGSWGVNIEIQKGELAVNGYLFGAAFVPDESGQPTYRIFSGPIEHLRDAWKTGGDLAIFEGKMVKPMGGTCIGCEHTKASPAVDAPEGVIKIVWHDNRNATLNWAGKSIEIAHWQWADNIGVDHSDWVIGDWLAVGGYGYTREPKIDSLNTQSGDRVRATSSASIIRSVKIPRSLDGNGWHFYDINLTLIRINQQNPNNGGGFDQSAKRSGELINPDTGFLLVFKPESDHFEIYLRHSDFTEFHDIGNSNFPVMRAFVKGQDEISAFGSHDARGLEKRELLDSIFLQLTRLPDGWDRALVLPISPNISSCED